MKFFEKCIRELWTVKGYKYGKWFKTKYKRYRQTTQIGRSNKNKKTVDMASLRKLSKVLGYSPSFLARLKKYERIDE